MGNAAYVILARYVILHKIVVLAISVMRVRYAIPASSVMLFAILAIPVKYVLLAKQIFLKLEAYDSICGYSCYQKM